MTYLTLPRGRCWVLDDRETAAGLRCLPGRFLFTQPRAGSHYQLC